MHDLDRTVLELNDESDELDAPAELEGPDELESLGEGDGPLSEADELELASEMLGLHDPGELEYFLGNLVKRIGGALKSPIGKMLIDRLKGYAKKALPMIASGLGATVGGPLGAQIAGSLASQAGSMFGLELEGLSGEDQEFESARRFVRFAGAAAQDAARAPGNAAPHDVVRSALVNAARTHAPGLLSAAPSSTAVVPRGHHRTRTGRWVLRTRADGSRVIVLYGV